MASDLLDAAQRIGAEVAGPAADAVDREARFPHEAIAALREERMLGALVPTRAGRPRRDDRRGRRRAARCSAGIARPPR